MPVFAALAVFFFGLFPSTAFACKTVTTWSQVKAAFEGANGKGTVTLCPFNIQKPENQKIILKNKKVTVHCGTNRKCILRGKGQHIFISGADSEVFVKGFVFRQATKSVVVVTNTSPKLHTFTHWYVRHRLAARVSPIAWFLAC